MAKNTIYVRILQHNLQRWQMSYKELQRILTFVAIMFNQTEMNKIEFPAFLAMAANKLVASADVSGMDLKGQGLQGVNVRFSSFDNVAINEVNATISIWYKSTMRRATGNRSLFNGSRFTDCIMSGADFSEAGMQRCTFETIELDRAPNNPGYNALSRTSFANANLSGSRFTNVDFINTDFRGANLTNCRFENCFAFGAVMDAKTNLSGSNLSGIRYYASEGVPWRYSITGEGNKAEMHSLSEKLAAARKLASEISEARLHRDYRYKAADLNAGINSFREMCGLTHKQIFTAIGMPERTYYAKRENPQSFTMQEFDAMYKAIVAIADVKETPLPPVNRGYL